MAGKPRIEKNIAKNNQYFLTLKSSNNKTVLTSGETYKTKQGLENAVKAAKSIVKGAVVVDNTQKKKK